MHIFEYRYVKEPPLITRDLIPAVAARFKALGDPGRLGLLAELHAGEKSVTELVAATGRNQPNVSQQLSSLAQAGLVACRRDGNRVIYRLSDPYLVRICNAVCASLEPDQRKRRGGRPGA